MASIYDLKPRFQAALRPLLGSLARHGVTPNALTVTAIVGSIGVGVAVSRFHRWPALFLLLAAWLLVRMALNALDGMMAREHQMASPLGAVLNELGDVISDLALYLPLALVYGPARWPVVAFAIGAVLTEFSGVLGVTLGAGRRYDGPMGKSDRAFLVGALGIVTFFAPGIMKSWPLIFGLGALLAGITCLNRARHALAVAARPGDLGPADRDRTRS